MTNGKTVTRRVAIAGTGAILSTPFIMRTLAQDAVLNLKSLRSTAKSWLWAAEDYANAAGFFAQAGVTVASTASGRGYNAQAFQDEGYDILLGDPYEASQGRARGQPIKTFAATVNRYASHVLLKKETLAKIGVDESSPPGRKRAALKGLRMGTTGPGAAPDALLRYLSALANLDPTRDLQLVVIQGGGPGMLKALEENAIDGFCLSSPTADLAVQRRGCGYLFQMALNPPPELKEYQYIVASATERTVESKREALTRYVRGLALALRSIESDQDKFKAWAKGWFDGMDPEIFESAFANNSKIYFSEPTPQEDLYERNLQFGSIVNQLIGADPLPDSLTFQTMCDPSLAEEALKSL